MNDLLIMVSAIVVGWVIPFYTIVGLVKLKYWVKLRRWPRYCRRMFRSLPREMQSQLIVNGEAYARFEKSLLDRYLG